MAPAQRFRLVGAAVAVAEVGLGVLLVGTILAPYFWACAAATLAVAVAASRFLQPPPPPPADDGGGGPGEPTAPTPPDPPWWPDFERALHDYSHSLREDTRRC
jgi:hypothetical protein